MLRRFVRKRRDWFAHHCFKHIFGQKPPLPTVRSQEILQSALPFGNRVPITQCLVPKDIAHHRDFGGGERWSKIHIQSFQDRDKHLPACFFPCERFQFDPIFNILRYSGALEEYKRALPYFKEADIQDELADTLNNMSYLLALLGRFIPAMHHIGTALKIREQLGYRYPIALSRNTRGRIYALQDPAAGEQECRAALKIFEELNEPRGIGLAVNGLGFALRLQGNKWKLAIYSYDEAQQLFQRAEQSFKRAVGIFSRNKPTFEPIRYWEACNELGSLYCDWAWLIRNRRNESREESLQDPLAYYAQSIDWQEEALKIAQERNLEFQAADSLENLAQVYGDRSFLYIHRQDLAAAMEDRLVAQGYLEQIENIIPNSFYLVAGEGFLSQGNAGEVYWRLLGEVYRWRSVWAFRDVEVGIVSTDQREDVLATATQEFVIALIYFRQYWQTSAEFQRTLGRLGEHLERAGVSSAWARDEVKKVAAVYKIDLNFVETAINDILGM